VILLLLLFFFYKCKFFIWRFDDVVGDDELRFYF